MLLKEFDTSRVDQEWYIKSWWSWYKLIKLIQVDTSRVDEVDTSRMVDQVDTSWYKLLQVACWHGYNLLQIIQGHTILGYELLGVAPLVPSVMWIHIQNPIQLRTSYTNWGMQASTCDYENGRKICVKCA